MSHFHALLLTARSVYADAEAAREADSAREIGGVCWRFFYSVFHSHFHALFKRRAGKNDIAF